MLTIAKGASLIDLIRWSFWHRKELFCKWMVVVTKESALARPSLPLFCLLLHPNLVWVSVSFLSAFKASGEKIGSFGSFASSLNSKLRKVAEGDNLHRLRLCLVGMPTPFYCRVRRQFVAYKMEGFCWVEVPHWLHGLHCLFTAYKEISKVLDTTTVSVVDLRPAFNQNGGQASFGPFLSAVRVHG